MRQQTDSSSTGSNVSVAFCVVLALLLVSSLGGVTAGPPGETAVQGKALGTVVTEDSKEQAPRTQTTPESVSVAETSITAEFIGVVQDSEPVTVEATGITDNGAPADEGSVTFTIGENTVANSSVTNGTANATIDPTTLNLTAGQSLSVGVSQTAVEDSATVEIVHEVRDLDAGYNLLSIPQTAEVATEGVLAVNVWNSSAQTYDVVTDSTFESPAQLHNGIYVIANSSDARFGLTFELEPAPVPGSVSITSGWNLVGSNFAISNPESGDTRTLDQDLIGVDLSTVTVYDQGFVPLNASSEIGPYQPYWVFVGSETTVTRQIIPPPYDPDNRTTVINNSR
jgi:hypothetical protein